MQNLSRPQRRPALQKQHRPLHSHARTSKLLTGQANAIARTMQHPAANAPNPARESAMPYQSLLSHPTLRSSTKHRLRSRIAWLAVVRTTSAHMCRYLPGICRQCIRLRRCDTVRNNATLCSPDGQFFVDLSTSVHLLCMLCSSQTSFHSLSTQRRRALLGTVGRAGTADYGCSGEIAPHSGAASCWRRCRTPLDQEAALAFTARARASASGRRSRDRPKS